MWSPSPPASTRSSVMATDHAPTSPACIIARLPPSLSGSRSGEPVADTGPPMPCSTMSEARNPRSTYGPFCPHGVIEQ